MESQDGDAMSGLTRRCVLGILIAASPGRVGAQPVPLTLADATARALERLPEVAIQREAVAIAALGETRALAAYDPVLHVDSRVRTRTDPVNSLFVGAPDGALAPRSNSLIGSVGWSRLFASGATVTGTVADFWQPIAWLAFTRSRSSGSRCSASARPRPETVGPALTPCRAAGLS